MNEIAARADPLSTETEEGAPAGQAKPRLAPCVVVELHAGEGGDERRDRRTPPKPSCRCPRQIAGGG